MLFKRTAATFNFTMLATKIKIVGQHSAIIWCEVVCKCHMSTMLLKVLCLNMILTFVVMFLNFLQLYDCTYLYHKYNRVFDLYVGSL